MSIAATRSHQGDEYQVCIALHWLIRLLTDESISYLQVDSNGIPESDNKVLVDDIVVAYVDQTKRFIQAKKNQSQHRAWRFSDHELKEELVKARDQLEQSSLSVVTFYSGSPFGEIQQVIDGCKQFPNHIALCRDGGRTLADGFGKLRSVLGRSDVDTFSLGKRLEFSSAKTFEEWDADNRRSLSVLVARPEHAERMLRALITNHQAKLRGAACVLKRTDVVEALEKEGLYLTPPRATTELLDLLKTASRIGRDWIRDIAGARFHRVAFSELLTTIDQKARTVLLTDGPGTGKTCVLLELADYLEQLPETALLFIKGDWFSDAGTEVDLINQGMLMSPHPE